MSEGAFDVVGDGVGCVGEVHVEALLSDVDAAIREPPIEMQVIDAESSAGEGVPLDPMSCFPPVLEGVSHCPLKRLLIGYSPAQQSP